MSNPGRTICKAMMSPHVFGLRMRKGTIRIVDGELEKKCPVCNEWWPADSEFFSVQNRRKDGLDWRCKACKSEAESKECRSHKARKSKYVAPDW